MFLLKSKMLLFVLISLFLINLIFYIYYTLNITIISSLITKLNFNIFTISL